MTISKFLRQHLMEKETWWSCMNYSALLQHPSCYSTNGFQKNFCQSEFHISSQRSFLDFITPSCNHSFHSAMPQEACPSGFLYLGIQVTWACWYWKGEKKINKNRKKERKTHQSKKCKSKVLFSNWKFQRCHMQWTRSKGSQFCITVPVRSIHIYCRKGFFFFTVVNTIILLLNSFIDFIWLKWRKMSQKKNITTTWMMAREYSSNCQGFEAF